MKIVKDITAYLKDKVSQSVYWKQTQEQLSDRKFWTYLLGVASLIIIFQKSIWELSVKYLITPIFSQCMTGIWTNFIFCVLGICALIFMFGKIIKYKLYPTFRSCLVLFAVLIVYFLMFRWNNKLEFYGFFSNTFVIKYADIFIISVGIFSLNYKTYNPPISKEPSLYYLTEDDPKISNNDDTYQRQGYAESISKFILGSTSEHSLGIAIVGQWGYGKTDLMRRIEISLSSSPNKSENLIFWFNPWNVKNADAIVEDFFKSLTKVLKPFNYSIENTIKEYSNNILNTADDYKLKVINSIFNGLDNNNAKQNFDSINRTIDDTGKRIVIFIDDLDRLTGKEVYEVLRLIRNSANFHNTFFIVGIDQDYIEQILDKENGIVNGKKYLEKIFQLSILLPTFDKKILPQKFLDIITDGVSDNDKDIISRALKKISIDTSIAPSTIPTSIFHYDKSKRSIDLLGSYIDSIRSLKRFANSFRLSYDALKEEVDISDLMVLELIKLKYTTIYTLLASRAIMGQGDIFSNYLSVNYPTDKNGKIDDTNNVINHYTMEKIPIDNSVRNALDFLFDSECKDKNTMRIVVDSNHFRYFSYQVSFSFSEFLETIKKDQNDIDVLFKRYIEERKEGDLHRVLSEMNDFEDQKQFVKIITVMFRSSNLDTELFNLAEVYLFQWTRNINKYFGGHPEKYNIFFRSLIDDPAIDLYLSGVLIRKFIEQLYGDTGSELKSPLFISIEELRTIALTNFERFLLSINGYDSRMQPFYLLNDYKTIEGREDKYYYKDANTLYLNYLQGKDPVFRSYLKNILLQNASPVKDTLVFDPWLEDIWEGWEKFKIFLLQYKINEDDDACRFKEIILKHIDKFYRDGKKAFLLDSEDNEFYKNFMSRDVSRINISDSI